MLSQPTSLSLRPALWLCAAAFFAESLFVALVIGPRSHSPDFYHFHFVPGAVRQGFNVYDKSQHPRVSDWVSLQQQSADSKRLRGCWRINQRLYDTGFCPTSTPFLYTIHALGLWIGFDVHFWIFHLAATALCLAGLYAIGRCCEFSPPASLLICGLIGSFCWGLSLDVQLANVTRFQIFGLALAMVAARSSHRWKMAIIGCVLAVGCAYKPTVLPSLGLWLFVLVLERRWRDLCQGLAGVALSGLASLVLPLILFDSLGCWRDWKAYAGSELARLADSFGGNYSIAAAIRPWGAMWAGMIAWMMLAGVVGALAGFSRRPARNASRDLGWRMNFAIALGPLWVILASPLVWIQYAALAMPLLIVVLGWNHATAQFRWGRFVVLLVAGVLSAGVVPRCFEINSWWLDVGLLWTGWLGLLGATLELAWRTSLSCVNVGNQADLESVNPRHPSAAPDRRGLKRDAIASSVAP